MIRAEYNPDGSPEQQDSSQPLTKQSKTSVMPSQLERFIAHLGQYKGVHRADFVNPNKVSFSTMDQLSSSMESSHFENFNLETEPDPQFFERKKLQLYHGVTGTYTYQNYKHKFIDQEVVETTQGIDAQKGRKPDSKVNLVVAPSNAAMKNLIRSQDIDFRCCTKIVRTHFADEQLVKQ